MFPTPHSGFFVLFTRVLFIQMRAGRLLVRFLGAVLRKTKSFEGEIVRFRSFRFCKRVFLSCYKVSFKVENSRLKIVTIFREDVGEGGVS
jgi:hypothetical protein